MAALRKNENKFYVMFLGTCVLQFALCVFIALRIPDGTGLSLRICGGLGFVLDGFRKIYMLIISFMWMISALFSHDYFRGEEELSRYYFFSLMTLGAISGVFLADDLMTALVFFEIMSFASCPWVVQEESRDALKAGETYLAVAVIGGLAALMGLMLLYSTLGTLSLGEIYERSLALADRRILYISGGLILFGFGAKAGMFPLHIWLPKAHPVAPSPASALLSGVLTKAGVW
ncbi:MAG: sodium:proton antiporter, partial [Eubacteriaceae bacterium]|nr:sodium:proton antiporter [Eubacteriaceae bacterium]